MIPLRYVVYGITMYLHTSLKIHMSIQYKVMYLTIYILVFIILQFLKM